MTDDQDTGVSVHASGLVELMTPWGRAWTMTPRQAADLAAALNVAADLGLKLALARRSGPN